MYFDQGEQRELKVSVMWKRAQRKKMLTSVNWKERVFVLTPITLNYFEGSAEKRGKRKGSIPLSSVKAVEFVEDTAFDHEVKKYCFQVVYDDLVLYISAKTKDERKEWVDSIQDECSGNKFLLMEYHPGIFVNKWTCCDRREKTAQGCQKSFAANEKDGYQDVWEIPRSEIVLGKVLDSGAFGTVRQGWWQGTPVAVKMRKEVPMSKDVMSEDDFINEAKVMTKLHHPHVVQLFGVYSEKPIYIITEFMTQGCLLAYLRKHQNHLQPPQMTEMVRQVAYAMTYLESRNFIHRDLAARNCLIGDNNIVKVANFHSARYVIDDEYTAPEGTKFPIKWAPPEVILYTKFSSKSDIWAFGVLTWEIYTGGKTPFPGRTNKAAVEKVMNGDRLLKPRRCPEEMFRIVERCWHAEPECRPAFASVYRSILEFTGEDNLPLENSFVPPEIRARGPEAKLAFQKALQNGKVKVYRGRIMLLGQDRAGKTSLKKSLLGMPFNPQEESTVGVEVDPSKCQVDIDQIKNWEPIKDKKLEVSEFAEDIAMLIAKDLSKGQGDKQDLSQPAGVLEERKMDELDGIRPKQSETSSPVAESTTNIKPESSSELHCSRDDIAEEKSLSSSSDQGVQLNIDTTAALSDDVTELVIQYLERLKLDDDIKAKEVILTLWDFAGQHLYYASHPVFLSPRAVYVLVYNLSKSLSAEAQPCVRQGIHDLLLDNPNSETNLDNLLAWLVSVHSIRRPAESKAVQGSDHQGRNSPYLRPPVFIVGTNADHPFENPKKMEKCIERGMSGNTYEEHVIRPFFAVDNTQSHNDDGIQKLQRKIIEVLKREPYMGEEVPIRWFNFEKVVEALVAKKTFHMSLDQLLTVTRRVCQIEDDAELTAMLNFYHDLGVIVKHGHTVVLQAQWLINLFKQLITVPPFNEVDPVFSKCWRELEENGILRMALVDHVFTEFIQNGLLKQDILDMMELYGLIGKFSCSSSTNAQVQEYFVPAQLRSTPSGLCEIRPSDSDPCPLYIHFPDGFVPYGLFSQLLSRSISWCSQQGLKQSPQLFNNGARLFIGMQSAFELFLICRTRFIKVVLKMSQRCRSMTGPLTAASTKMANEVRAFFEASLKALTSELSWLQNLQYELCVACCLCLQNGDQCTKHESKSCSQDECLHLLRVHPGEEPICTKSHNGELVKVNGLEKWFQAYKAQHDEETLECPFVCNEILKDFASLKCGKPSTDDLLLIAYDLGSSWKMFGRVLNLDKPQLEQIEEDERKLIEKSYGMLKKWLESCGGTATYQSLAVAFQQLGRTDLAAKYCNVHSDPCKAKAGTPCSKDLLDIAGEFGASWKMFCRALHLTEATLAEIEENERDMVSKCHAVLRMWTEKWGSEATYQRLAQALQHPAVKHSNLAAKYCHVDKSTS